MPVEYHEHHPRECQRRACDLPPRHPLAAIEEAHHHGGPHGRRADDQRNVRGRGVLQSHVFGKEIERPSAQPRGRQQQFVAQVRGPHASAGEGQDADVCHSEPEQENFRRSQRVGDQDLRRNERRAPYGHREQRREVVFVFRVFYHTAPKIRIFLRRRTTFHLSPFTFHFIFLSLRAIVRNDNNYNK